MADIFDQVAAAGPGPAPAPAGKGDIFDQVAGGYGSAPAAPGKGDIFDQVAGTGPAPASAGPGDIFDQVAADPLAGLIPPSKYAMGPAGGEGPAGMLPIDWKKSPLPIGRPAPSAWPTMSAKADEILGDTAGANLRDVKENIIQPAWGTVKDMGNALGSAAIDPFLQAAGLAPYFTRQLERDPGPIIGLGRTLSDWEATKAAADQVWHEISHPMETLAKRPITAPLDLIGLIAGGASALRGAGRLASRVSKSELLERLAGLDVRSQLRNALGTKSDRLGADVYGSHMYHQAKGALNNRMVKAETGRYSLSPGMQKVMSAAGLLSPSRGLIAGQTIRDAVYRMGPLGRAAAKKMGITPDEMATAARIAETIPFDAVSPEGTLRFGVQVKDADGVPGWRHGLDPAAAQALFAGQRPEVQRFILGYVEPAGGYQGPVRLAAPGLSETASRVAQFADEAMTGQGSHNRTLEYSTVSRAEAEALRQQTGLEGLEGFRHVLDNQNLRHALQGHGDPAREAARGQLPITREDIARIPEVVSSYDAVQISRPGGGRRPATIRYMKRVNGSVFIVEEVRNTAGDLAFKSMWKKKRSAAANALPGQNRTAPDYTSETGGAPNTSIANAGQPGNALGAVLPLPQRPGGGPPTTFSRNKAFDEAVSAGILEPGQRVEGYVTWAHPHGEHAPRLGNYSPELDLYAEIDLPFSKSRARARRPDELRLDEAINFYRQALGEATNNIDLLKEVIPQVLKPAPVNPETGHYLRLPPEHMFNTRTVFDPFSGQEKTLKIPQIEVELPLREAQVLGLEPGKYLLDKPYAEDFKLLMGWAREGKVETLLTGVNQAGKDAARFFVQSALGAPGTAATNFIGGGTQYLGSHLIEDLLRGNLRQVGHDLAAPAQALRPSVIRATPPEILGLNQINQFGENLGLFGRRGAEKIKAGEKVLLPTRAAVRADQAAAGAYKVLLSPFGSIDNYWKRVLYFTELWPKALDEARAMAKAGKIEPGEVKATARRLFSAGFDNSPDDYKQAMLGPVDRAAYNYDNRPPWLDKVTHSWVGTMLAPFMTYGYKYGRMLGRQAAAFLPPPLVNMPLGERIARGGALVGTGYVLPKALHRLIFGESELEPLRDEFREQYPDAPMPGTNLGGRDYAGSPEPGKERWLRTAKYGYWNLPAAASRGLEGLVDFLDEFRSEGPALHSLGMAMGMEPARGRKDPWSILGKGASSFIPFFRILDYLAKAQDVDPETGRIRHRQPVGFWDQLKVKIPGLRQELRQPIDRYTNEPITLDPVEEAAKFWTGVNVRTLDVSREKQAMAEAVLRWGDRIMKEDQVVAYYMNQNPGLDPEKVRQALPRIRQAGRDYLYKSRGQVEHQVFRSLEPLIDVLDPNQVRLLAEAQRQAGNLAVRGQTGVRNLPLGTLALQLTGGNAYIQANMEALR